MGNLAASFAAAKLRALNYVVLHDTGSLPGNLGKGQILHVLCDKDHVEDFCSIFQLQTTDRQIKNNEFYTAPYTAGIIRVTPKGLGYFPETFETRLLTHRCWDFGGVVPVTQTSVRFSVIMYEFAVHGAELSERRREIILAHMRNSIGIAPPYKAPGLIVHNDNANFNEPASATLLPIDIKAD